jgi:D-glycero-beta-D-manno-heptose-7-phosphate kinase
MSTHLKALIPQLANQTILVIGDVILDEYVIGQATRMSREAPIPVLEFESRRTIAGGSANPSANIVALGSQALQVGIIGEDDSGAQLTQVLQSNGIDTTGIITCTDRPTTVKTRIMAQMGLRFPQQVARIDTLSRQPITPKIEQNILNFIKDNITTVNGVLLSHYHGGLLTETLVQHIRDLCHEHQVLITADAQGNFDKFTGMDVIKCNADDASTYLGIELETDDDFSQSARTLYQQLNLKRAMVITRGSDGATLATSDQIYHCPSPDVSDVFDTVGAGDTSIALITLALAREITPQDAVMLANYASGIVVRHVGNYTPSPSELEKSIPNDILR